MNTPLHSFKTSPTLADVSSGKSGLALITVILFVAAIGILGVTAFQLGLSDIETSKNYTRGVDAFYAAEAGAQYVFAKIRADAESGYLTLDGTPCTVNYPAPSGFNFDTVTTIDVLADGKTYLFTVTGRNLDSQATIEVTFKADGTTASGLFSEYGIEVASASSVTGDIGANGDILVKTGSTVTGDAIPGPGHQTIIDSGTTVTGSTSPNTDNIWLDPVDSADLAAAMSVNDNTTIDSSLFTGSNDLFIASGDGPVTLSGGTYGFNQMTVEDDVTVIGTVTIYTTDSIVFRSGAVINLNTASPENLIIYSSTTGTVILDGSTLYGHIYAPNASSVLIVNGSVFHGTLLSSGPILVDSTSSFSVNFSGFSSGASSVSMTSWKLAR